MPPKYENSQILSPMDPLSLTCAKIESLKKRADAAKLAMASEATVLNNTCIPPPILFEKSWELGHCLG